MLFFLIDYLSELVEIMLSDLYNLQLATPPTTDTDVFTADSESYL